MYHPRGNTWVYSVGVASRVHPSMAHNIEDLLHSSKCPTVIKANLEKEGFLDYLKKSLWQEISSDHVTTQEEAKESIRVALTSSGEDGLPW